MSASSLVTRVVPAWSLLWIGVIAAFILGFVIGFVRERAALPRDASHLREAVDVR